MKYSVQLRLSLVLRSRAGLFETQCCTEQVLYERTVPRLVAGQTNIRTLQ